MPQYDPQAVALAQQRLQSGRTGNETALIELARVKQSQASEEEVMAFLRQHPELLVGGGSTIGSLQTATASAPGGMPMTQQTFGAGSPPGAPQVVPGGQDLSRFAAVSPQGGGPIPQSVLASLGPQGGMAGPQQASQPQQAPQNPLLEMARRDPRAAMMLSQQLEQRQDLAMKRSEQQLSMGVKVMEYIARGAQAVRSQEDLEALRQDIARVHPQAAASLPQMYSPEAMQPFITRGTAATDRAKNALDEAKARNLDMETRLFPELAKRFGMEGDVQAPADGSAPATTAAPTAGTQVRTAPAEYDSAITQANRLYPQVSATRIKAIIAAESNFDARAVSPAGAQGLMQLMPGTAKDMGVVDPFDIKQNVRGGTRYYAQMLTKYGGDERKALAAYNWGPGNLDNVGGDVSKAPAQTQAYVNRVLGGGGGGGGTGTAQAEAADPRIAPLEAKIAQRTRDAKIASLMKNESLSTRLNDDANRLTAEKNRLIEESRSQQERREEIPRAVARTTAETEEKQRLERQRQEQPMLPDARRKFLTDLRSDIRAEPTFKTYQEVRNGYQNVRTGAESNSAPGDLAIVNGIAKIMDPGSTVREGEFATIESAQGRLQVLLNTKQRFFEGDRLTPESRQRFLTMAQALAQDKLTTAQTELRAVYEPLAKEGNIQFGQLLPLEDLKPLAPQGGKQPVSNVDKFKAIKP